MSESMKPPIPTDTFFVEHSRNESLQSSLAQACRLLWLEDDGSPRGSATFPFKWAGSDSPGDGRGSGPVLDPLTVYVDWSEHGREDDACVWAVSLRAMLAETVELVERFDGTIDAKVVHVIGGLRDALAEEIVKLDAVLARPRWDPFDV